MIRRGTLIFLQSSGNTMTDILTRVLSGSGVVHCGIALGDGKMINARGNGVCISNDQEGQDVYAVMPGPQVEAVIAYCTAQIGKPYDYSHLLADPIWNAFHFYIGCGAPQSFNCSTLLASAIRSVQRNFIIDKPLGTITPQDILNAFPQASITQVYFQ